jgi:cell division protein FtsZ
MKYAEIGIRELKEAADVVITSPGKGSQSIPDDNLLLEDTYSEAQNFFCRVVGDISEILAKPGILNVELSEMRALIRQNEATFIGVGISTGPNRAEKAVLEALANPFLEEMPIGESNSALMHVVAARQSLKLQEVNVAAQMLKERANLENILISAMHDPRMEDEIKATVIASTASQPGSESLECHLRIPEGGTDTGALQAEAQGENPSSCIRDWKELDRPAFRRRHGI